MKINYKNINEYVRKFNDDEELLQYIKNTIYDLYIINKNYNNSQWCKIQDLKEIFDNIEYTHCLQQAMENEVNFNIETLVNDELLEYQKKDIMCNFSDKDIEEIADNIINDTYIWGIINDYIRDEILRKVHEKGGDSDE